MRTKKFVVLAATAVLAFGGVLGGGMAAMAAQPDGCDVAPGIPYKSGVEIKGNGTGTCLASKSLNFYYEIHKSFGVTNPTTVSGSTGKVKQKSWTKTVKGCDTNILASDKYFGQAYFVGSDWKTTKNSPDYTICN